MQLNAIYIKSRDLHSINTTLSTREFCLCRKDHILSVKTLHSGVIMAELNIIILISNLIGRRLISNQNNNNIVNSILRPIIMHCITTKINTMLDLVMRSE